MIRVHRSPIRGDPFFSASSPPPAKRAVKTSFGEPKAYDCPRWRNSEESIGYVAVTNFSKKPSNFLMETCPRPENGCGPLSGRSAGAYRLKWHRLKLGNSKCCNSLAVSSTASFPEFFVPRSAELTADAFVSFVDGPAFQTPAALFPFSFFRTISERFGDKLIAARATSGLESARPGYFVANPARKCS
jgi:hypothetical protein